MPRYDYRCPDCGVFERVGKLDEREVEHDCGNVATRLPFSGVPALKGDTVARSIPDPAYRQEAQKRELNRTWGDASRSVEMLRKAAYTDAQGHKQIDMRKMH